MCNIRSANFSFCISRQNNIFADIRIILNFHDHDKTRIYTEYRLIVGFQGLRFYPAGELPAVVPILISFYRVFCT